MAKHYQGKRVATQPTSKPKRTFNPTLFLLIAGVALTLIVWGVLVWAAISFGSDARGGDSGAWVFLALAAVAACGTLFATLMLITRLSRALGFTSGGRSVRPVSTIDPGPHETPRAADDHRTGGARRAG